MEEKKKSKKGLLLVLLFSVAALGIALVLCATIGTGFGKSDSSSKQENYVDSDNIQKQVMKTLNLETLDTVYDTAFQSAVKTKLDKMKQNYNCTFEDPLFVMNPFGTNVTGLYAFFRTDEETNIEYTISVNDVSIPEFTRRMYTDEEGNPTKKHEGQIIGLIQGMTNTVTLRQYDKADKFIGEASFKIEVPDYGTIKEEQLKVTNKQDAKKLSNGLFVIFGYDRRNKKEPRHMLFYDNDGVIRAEVPLDVSYGDVNLEIIDGMLFYACSDSSYAYVNPLGQVEDIFKTDGYTTHHDFAYDEQNKRIIALATKKKSKSKQDIILSLNLNTGDVEEVIDFGDLMPDVKKGAVISKDAPDQEDVDWVHFNSVQVINGRHLILSSRELSSIIRINNYYTTPKIGYIIADSAIWKGTPYSGLVLDKVGRFPSQAGQHSVNYVQDSSLKSTQYYLTFYNNNYAQRLSYPDFDWSFIKNVGMEKKDADNSYYYKYLVDEKKGTYKLVEKIKVPYSSIVSNVQEYDGNRVICSGEAGVFGEYDEKGKLISRYKMKVKYLTYRVMKETMEGYWFN
ncbi:aryl-sulfate sulfotransferase [Anaerosporobacter faecicola]|uniref:aryl-sulfate sulfotransferase n=1 Tax=Anaerosporobacter faecicola TaxID=2718714 RepID=UPI00143C12B2|nr:aryl-sulfate sulfotransferase [Anaerosporobacter faecicola]